MVKIRVTNKDTGEVFEGDSDLGVWERLCLDIMDKYFPNYRVIYCDTECLLRTGSGDDETWYFLDECGNWEYLPLKFYKVEVL